MLALIMAKNTILMLYKEICPYICDPITRSTYRKL